MGLFERFFNTAAYMIRSILDSTDEKFFERYSALGREAWEGINDCLEQTFPELFQDKQPVEIMASPRYDDDFFERLYSFGISAKTERALQQLVCLVSKLDISLSKRVENFSASQEIQGLNTNMGDVRIQVLPRCSCFWEHKSRGGCYTNCLSNYLKYFLYINLDDVRGFQIWHYFLNQETFSEARERKTLQIGISPLSNAGKLRWIQEEREGVLYFSVTEVENGERVAENLAGILEEAREKQVDVLCFPEMLGSRQIYTRAVEQLSQFPKDDKLYPALTVLPSLWEDHHNTAVVLDEMGERVISQEKQHSFLFPDQENKNKYLEDLRPDRQIHLIHCEGIGRIAVLICKDALMIEYLQMVLSVLKVTLLLIPSFSTGNYNFQEVIECCKVADCCAFWINTCSVQQLTPVDNEKFDVIAMALKSGKSHLIRNGLYCNRRSKQGGCQPDGGNCGRCLYIHKLQFGDWG